MWLLLMTTMMVLIVTNISALGQKDKKLTLAAFAAGAASGELLRAYATITELTSGKRQDGRTGRRTDTRPLLSVMVA